MNTPVNIPITLAKLESEINGANYATVKTGLLRMAVQAIRQQQAEIKELRELVEAIKDGEQAPAI